MNRIHAPDGTPLVYDAYEPPAPELAVLFFHGWGARDAGGRWTPLAERLRELGVAAYALDQRGHGRSGGRRLHLTRFSQLLGDLQAFRRVVRGRRDVPQLLVGQGFGALVVLRYLETQPGESPLGAVVANPSLRSRRSPPWWRRMAIRFADVWPTVRVGAGSEAMTAGAGAEIAWAQQAVARDAARIEAPVLFLLAADDPLTDPFAARALASRLGAVARVEDTADPSAPSLIDFARTVRSLERPPKNE